MSYGTIVWFDNIMSGWVKSIWASCWDSFINVKWGCCDVIFILPKLSRLLSLVSVLKRILFRKRFCWLLSCGFMVISGRSIYEHFIVCISFVNYWDILFREKKPICELTSHLTKNSIGNVSISLINYPLYIVLPISSHLNYQKTYTCIVVLVCKILFL